MSATFASEIRQWRKSLGLLQKEAADRLGVNKRTYENWEYGREPNMLAQMELKRRMDGYKTTVEQKKSG